MTYALYVAGVLIGLIVGLFLVYRYNYTRVTGKIDILGAILATSGLVLTIVCCIGFYILTIPAFQHAEYRHRVGADGNARGIADPLTDLLLEEDSTTGKKVTWHYPTELHPLWVAITIYHGSTKETFVRDGTCTSFDDNLTLKDVTKVTGWYGTPSGPSGLAEWLKEPPSPSPSSTPDPAPKTP